MKITELKSRAEVAEWGLEQIEKDRKRQKYIDEIYKYDN
jgi:hypothetical protein